MEVNDALVDKLAKLSKLRFDDEAKKAIKDDLTRMLAFVNQLNKVNTDGVEPLIFMSDEINVLREDAIEDTVSQKEALKNAPQHDSGYFKVPKVIGGQ
jgi:aspartyl-tRNA(Asn)/glutamyl-tRNA(Gln) amidotransferase subunit C